MALRKVFVIASEGDLNAGGIPPPDQNNLRIAVAAQPRRCTSEQIIPVEDDPQQFIRLEQSPTRWPVPEALGGALAGFGAALVARDAAGLARWLASERWASVFRSMISGLATLRSPTFRSCRWTN